MANNVKIVEQEIKKVSRKQIKQVIINNFQDLQKEAIQFILQADKVATLISEKQKHQSLPSFFIETTQLYNNMRYRSRDIIVRLTRKMESFQSAITKFQNNTLGLLYMNQKTGKIIVQSDLQMQKFFATYVTRNKGRGNVSMSQNRQKILQGLGEGDPIRQKFKQLEERLNKQSALHYSILQEAFSRQSRQDMVYKIRDPQYKNSFHYRMSRTKIGWSKATGGHGFINQAYLRGLIYSLFQGGSLERNLTILAQQLEETSGKGAALGQDIQIDLDGIGHVHFAVKTNQFSTGMIRQFIILAFVIVGLSTETTAQQFINLIENKQINYENIAEKFINDFYTTDTSLEDFLKDFRGKITF